MRHRATSLRLISSIAARPFAHYMAHPLGDKATRYSTILRVIICATLITILTMGAGSAQSNVRDIQGGENSLRTEQEKKNDKAIDRAYQSTIKNVPLKNVEEKKSDPWADVRPPAPAKNKQ